jgi:cell division cycle 14
MSGKEKFCRPAAPRHAQVRRFLDICDASARVAVHCCTGLGRTGTLIALWLMRRAGFTARQVLSSSYHCRLL